jgi:hypothetical protein
MAPRLTKAQVKAMADRAEARSRDATMDDDDVEWQRGFDETCDKAWRERSREIIEAEIERLALLTTIDYEIERKAAAERLAALTSSSPRQRLPASSSRQLGLTNTTSMPTSSAFG